MGVAPKAIVDFFEYRLKSLLSSSSFDMTCVKQFFTHFLLEIFVSSGVRPALSMGVAPGAIMG
jgi:hypothetical protein